MGGNLDLLGDLEKKSPGIEGTIGGDFGEEPFLEGT